MRKIFYPLTLLIVLLISGCAATQLDSSTTKKISNYPQCAPNHANYGFFEIMMSSDLNDLVKPCVDLKEKEYFLSKYPTCKESIEKSHSAGIACMEKKEKENKEAILAKEKKDKEAREARRIEKREREIAAKNKRNEEIKMCFAVVNKVSKSHRIGEFMKLTHVEDHGANLYKCVALYNRNGRAIMYSVMHNNKSGKNTVKFMYDIGPAMYQY